MMSSTPEEHLPYPFRSFLADIWSFVRLYRGQFLLATLARVCGDLANLVPAYALSTLVSFLAIYERGTSLTILWVTVGAVAAAGVIRYGGLYVAKRIMYAVGERIALDAELARLEHMTRLSPTWHEEENSGNKLKRIDRGAYGLDRILRIWINNIIEITVNFVGITIILATVDVRISLSTLVFVATYYVVARFYIVRAGKASEVVNATEETVWGLLYETLSNIRTVQVLHIASALMYTLKKQATELYEKVLARIFWFQTGSTSRAVWGYAFQTGMLGFVAWGVAEGRYEVGFLVLFNTYFNRAWGSVEELSDVVQELIVAKYGIARMMRILKTEAHPVSEDHLASLAQDWQILSVDGLSFSYGEREVLTNVSFSLKRGERLGLVGLSGAGKSTLFKLLLREHEPQRGAVCIDGAPLSTLKRSSYFQHVAVVLQETEVFNVSLRDNITLANREHEHDEALLERALTVAHVRDFLPHLPQGVHSVIGEKGVRLSGGERQRLGIARAIFKQPSLLLLDEATSHLDLESEELIRDSLHEFFKGISAIVIAHRLTTIKEMDRILVLRNGFIVEEGSFANLIAAGGHFAELWNRQNL